MMRSFYSVLAAFLLLSLSLFSFSSCSDLSSSGNSGVRDIHSESALGADSDSSESNYSDGLNSAGSFPYAGNKTLIDSDLTQSSEQGSLNSEPYASYPPEEQLVVEFPSASDEKDNISVDDSDKGSDDSSDDNQGMVIEDGAPGEENEIVGPVVW